MHYFPSVLHPPCWYRHVTYCTMSATLLLCAIYEYDYSYSSPMASWNSRVSIFFSYYFMNNAYLDIILIWHTIFLRREVHIQMLGFNFLFLLLFCLELYSHNSLLSHLCFMLIPYVLTLPSPFICFWMHLLLIFIHSFWVWLAPLFCLLSVPGCQIFLCSFQLCITWF